MDKIKAIVIDDSNTYCVLIANILRQCDDVEVVAKALDGEEGLKLIGEHKPDLVFCDIFMPGLNGDEVLLKVKEKYPNIQVVMISGVCERNADVTVQALSNGALSFIRKPDSMDGMANKEILQKDIGKVLDLIRKKTEPIEVSTPKVIKKVKPTFCGTPAVVAVGVSTGGPAALQTFLMGLPKDFAVPIVLVQHIPEGFSESLVRSLNAKTQIEIVEAKDGDLVEAGNVYIAPGGRHMLLRDKEGVVEIGLNDGPKENSCRPAVDVLFRSISSVYGDKGVLALIMTGMGEDGCRGVRTLKRKNCHCITQTADSCVVYGMPKAVDDSGLSDESVALDDLAARVCELCNVIY